MLRVWRSYRLDRGSISCAPAIQADHPVGKYLDLGHINISRAGFRDISWESYKALPAKWPRADWRGRGGASPRRFRCPVRELVAQPKS
jgi:hypothetical protein